MRLATKLQVKDCMLASDMVHSALSRHNTDNGWKGATTLEQVYMASLDKDALRCAEDLS